MRRGVSRAAFRPGLSSLLAAGGGLGMEKHGSGGVPIADAVWRHRSLIAMGSQSRGPLCKQQMCGRFRARVFKLSFHMLV